MIKAQTISSNTIQSSTDYHRIIQAQHHDPMSFLGLHSDAKTSTFRTYQPYAKAVWIQHNDQWQSLENLNQTGIFIYQVNDTNVLERPIKLKISNDETTYELFDPYSFPTTITKDERYLFAEGNLKKAYKTFGAQSMTLYGVEGIRFAVWAPNAERVSVIGSFNQWDGRIHSMQAHVGSGIWELFIPNLTENDLYKFEIRNRDTGELHVKTDPFGFEFEALPGTANRIHKSDYKWQDQQWLETRAKHDWLHAPFNCYEVHLGAWQRNENGEFLTYRELAKSLVPYVAEMGYTHVELLPITEHPLNESWGYQTTGYFAVTNRFGSPDDFKHLVDCFHKANIGVILDWVPGHFPKDDWALARFDGTPLYEHEDPRLGEHQDWGTYIFNYGRNEVRNFLIANAHFWLNEFHLDGLRVDAVASMLYLDYSRNEGEWLPNKFGGRENLDVIDFLKQLNVMVGEDFPGALTIAEESTAWPMVSRPVYMGGLGFSMKWNMGWMNDTLSYFEEDSIHRKYHQNKLTFGQLYAYSENFVLPFSHDEVVHGKSSLLDKMPGDHWRRFANLRLLTVYQMTSSGKKLNFMGNEIAQGREWNVNDSLDWHLVEDDYAGHAWHQGIHRVHHDLNQLYRSTPALYTLDFDPQGFAWLDCENAQDSTISYIRRGIDNSFVIILLNFTPVVRTGYRVGVPEAGKYQELFNSDASCYGGNNNGNGAGLEAEATPWMDQPYSVIVTMPPLAGVILQKTD